MRMNLRLVVAAVVPESSDAWVTQCSHGQKWCAVLEIHDENKHAQVISQTYTEKLTTFFSSDPIDAASVGRIINSFTSPYLVSCIILVTIGDAAYIVSRNGGKAFLKRLESFAVLTHGDGTIGGKCQTSDMFILTSKTTGERFPDQSLLSMIDHLPLEDVAAEITVKLHAIPDATGCGVAVVRIEKADENVVDLTMTETQSRSLKKMLTSSALIWSVRRFIRPRTRYSVVKRKVGLLISRLRSVDGRIALVLAIVFIGSIVFGVRKELSLRLDATTITAIQTATSLYDEGSALIELNPVKSRESLVKADQIITPLLTKVSVSTKSGRQLKELSVKIRTSLTHAKREYETEPTLFYDPSLLKVGSRATDLSFYGDTIALLDPTLKTVYALSISSKNGQIIGGGDGFEDASSVAIHGDMVYVLVGKSIHAISIRDKKTIRNIVKQKETGDWGNIRKMTSFGGNLYLLDAGKQRIWKYQSLEKGFSDQKEYLNPDTLPDFSDSTGFAIDGSVYVGGQKGTVQKFTQGKEDIFHMQGLDIPFSGALLPFVSDTTESIYILESSAKRVVVFDKDGMYKAQYKWSSAITPINITVDEPGKRLLLLADGKLYRIDLQ
jgi:hypothetical protein